MPGVALVLGTLTIDTKRITMVARGVYAWRNDASRGLNESFRH